MLSKRIFVPTFLDPKYAGGSMSDMVVNLLHRVAEGFRWKIPASFSLATQLGYRMSHNLISCTASVHFAVVIVLLMSIALCFGVPFLEHL